MRGHLAKQGKDSKITRIRRKQSRRLLFRMLIGVCLYVASLPVLLFLAGAGIIPSNVANVVVFIYAPLKWIGGMGFPGGDLLLKIGESCFLAGLWVSGRTME